MDGLLYIRVFMSDNQSSISRDIFFRLWCTSYNPWIHLNYLNPLGFVSREFSLIKEFILISLAIEYFVLMISCVRPVIMFGLTTSIWALINRITLDWGWLRNRKKPAGKVMWKGSLLANEKAVWFKITDG